MGQARPSFYKVFPRPMPQCHNKEIDKQRQGQGGQGGQGGHVATGQDDQGNLEVSERPVLLFFSKIFKWR